MFIVWWSFLLIFLFHATHGTAFDSMNSWPPSSFSTVPALFAITTLTNGSLPTFSNLLIYANVVHQGKPSVLTDSSLATDYY